MPDSDSIPDARMQRLKDGDPSAMEEIVDLWQKPLQMFAYRYVGDSEAARDIAQETFIRLYKARHRFCADCTFRTWIYRIAANLSRNHLRWRRRRRECEWTETPSEPTACSNLCPAASNPATDLIHAEDLETLHQVIRRMPHSLKTALILHYVEELSYFEISQILGCSERGVESRLYRARKYLAKQLGLPPDRRLQLHWNGELGSGLKGVVSL